MNVFDAVVTAFAIFAIAMGFMFHLAQKMAGAVALLTNDLCLDLFEYHLKYLM